MRNKLMNQLIGGEEKESFHDVFSKILEEKLKIFKFEKLDRTLCLKIYTSIFGSLVEIVQTSGLKLTNEACNYITQQYYEGIVINNDQRLDPEIFTQKAKLENIETKELTFMSMLLEETDFLYPIIQEIKKRS